MTKTYAPPHPPHEMILMICINNVDITKIHCFMKYSVCFQIVVGKLSRIFCLKAEPYTSIPSDLSHMDSGDSEMRGAYELGFDSPGGKTSMEKTLEDIRHYVKLCSARVVEPQPSFPSHRELVINEWHQVALVVDRLMFVTFTVVTAVVTVTILGHSLNR